MLRIKNISPPNPPIYIYTYICILRNFLQDKNVNWTWDNEDDGIVKKFREDGVPTRQGRVQLVKQNVQNRH